MLSTVSENFWKEALSAKADCLTGAAPVWRETGMLQVQSLITCYLGLSSAYCIAIFYPLLC